MMALLRLPGIFFVTNLKLSFALTLLVGLAQPAQSAEHGVILQYHHVATDTPPSTSISPADFRAHLDYLRDHGFHVMALDEMLDALRNHQSVPDKSVAITFDDGYSSIYDTAFPLLQEYRFPFTLFVSTGPIDDEQPGFMDWNQIRDMADSGAIIANHMVEHPYMLTRLPEETEERWLERLRAELLSAEQSIAANTGQSHRYLAYPYGEFNPAIKAMLAEEGFVGLAQNSGAVGVDSDFLALPRFPLAGIYADLETARIKLDSLAFSVEQQDPQDPVTRSTSPSVRLKFAPGAYSFDQIGCFANSRPLPMVWLDKAEGLLELQADQQFEGRRWRYLCTAPLAGTGRYFWYSVQWINPDRGG